MTSFRVKRLSCIVAAIILALSSTTVAARTKGTAEKQPRVVEDPIPHPATYEVGDTLKVLFYEPLNATNSKWTVAEHPKVPGPSFYLHTELSGRFVVQKDWRITIPVIGSVVVANRDPDEVKDRLTAAFSKVIGHPGFVTVSIVARKPIYVVGPVKKPGSYKYAPSLTPLDIVALAGGVAQSRPEKWETVEALRESGNERASLDRLRQAWARHAVLTSELTGKPLAIPSALIELSGMSGAEKLVAIQKAERVPVIQARAEHIKSLDVAVKTAQKLIEIDLGRIPTLQKDITARQHRVDGFRKLHASGSATNSSVDAALAELAEAEDRRANVTTKVNNDRRRLALAKINAALFESKVKADLSKQVAHCQREIDQLTPQISADARIVNLLRSRNTENADAHLRFKIVRGSKVIKANITTILHPGDLLEVETDQPLGAETTSASGYQELSLQD